MDNISDITNILSQSGPWGIVAILGFFCFKGAREILTLARDQTAALLRVTTNLENMTRALEALKTEIEEMQRRKKDPR